MRGIWGAAGLTGGLALGSCVDLLPYQCADDGDCTSMDGGLCEADSYCSYPDDACPSGRRYSDLAGILSGKCAGTPPGGSGDTVDPTLGSDTSASTMSSGSGPDPDSSGDIGLPECGDGMVDDDEECDDGNEQDGDGCNTDCVRSGSIRWEATYAGSAGEDDRYFGLALTGADAVVTAGYIVNEAGNRDVLISRWPADGVDPTHVFHDAGTQSDAAEAVAYVDSGDVFICGVAGGDPWVSRWTASLDTLTAEAIVAAVGGTCRDVVYAAEDDVVAVGGGSAVMGVEPAWTYRFSADDPSMGDVAEVLDAPETSFKSVVVGPDGLLYVAGQVDDQAVVYRPPDPTTLGDAIYTSRLLRQPQSMLVLDDRIILGGETFPVDNDHWLQQLDLDGQPEWEYAGPEPLDDEIEDIALGPAGDIYATGFITADDHDRWVGKFDPEGNPVWARNDFPMSELAEDRGRSIVVLPDGDLIVVGSVSNGNDLDAWIARLAP